MFFCLFVTIKRNKVCEGTKFSLYERGEKKIHKINARTVKRMKMKQQHRKIDTLHFDCTVLFSLTRFNCCCLLCASHDRFYFLSFSFIILHTTLPSARFSALSYLCFYIFRFFFFFGVRQKAHTLWLNNNNKYRCRFYSVFSASYTLLLCSPISKHNHTTQWSRRFFFFFFCHRFCVFLLFFLFKKVQTRFWLFLKDHIPVINLDIEKIFSNSRGIFAKKNKKKITLL